MKIGLVKPSTNVTMERELPILVPGLEFSVQGVELLDVTPESLARMNAGVPEAAKKATSNNEPLVVSACLVAAMLAPGGHEAVESEMEAVSGVKAISSAGALVRQLLGHGYRRVAVLAPYSSDLMDKVIDYLTARGIAVCAYKNFGVVDNEVVAAIHHKTLVAAAKELDLTRADALVVSACVQMPSVGAMLDPELRSLGIPFMSASLATAKEIEKFMFG